MATEIKWADGQAITADSTIRWADGQPFVYYSGSSAIPHTNWTLTYADSQELAGENGAATNAFDGSSDTFWHTQWLGAEPPPPHEIQIDLGQTYTIDGFRYLPRQDGGVNGRIGQYEFYVSEDGVNWGNAVATGIFANNATEKEVAFPPTTGRFIRLRALTEVNGNPWISMAEINLLGYLPSSTPSGGSTISLWKSQRRKYQHLVVR